MRKVKPCSGVSANNPVATEKLITVAINTLRRPIRSASQAPDPGAHNGTDAGREQDDRRLPIGELPGANYESQNEPDQEIIKKFQHVAENGGEHDAPLVSCKFLLMIEKLKHGISLCDVWLSLGCGDNRWKPQQQAISHQPAVTGHIDGQDGGKLAWALMALSGSAWDRVAYHRMSLRGLP